MFLIRLIYRFLSLFQSHRSTQGVSFGLCFGFLLALSPPSTIQFWLLLSLFFLIKMNLLYTLFSVGVCSIGAYLGSPLFTTIGEYLLTRKTLLKFWSHLYEMPIVPFTDFYVPEVLGKMFLAFLLIVPLFIFSMKLVNFLTPLAYHWWRTTFLYNLYRSYKPYA